MVEYLDDQPWTRFGGAAWLVGKGVEILIVAGDDPADLSLPVVVIDQDLQLVADPLIGRDIAALARH